MIHEASFYDHNQFLTLSYADDKIPDLGNLDQRDMQLFFKRLRKTQNSPIRYVYCGEYGENTSRPHYHAIVFGLPLTDRQHFKSNDRGDKLYQSPQLEKLWGNGFVTIGDVTPQSCGYVAGYLTKDIKSTNFTNSEYLHFNKSTGELTPRTRPFVRYSNRPGIGKRWIDKYYKDVFPQDVIRTRDGTSAVPQYYFDRLQKLDPEMYNYVKNKRDNALYTPHNKWNSKPDRLKVRETVKLAKLNLSKRGSAHDPKSENTIFTDLQDPSPAGLSHDA